MRAGAGDVTPVGYSNGFAVFSSYEQGYNAMISNLQTPRYQSQTIAGAVATWAPQGDGNNDPVAYAQHITRETGISSNTAMNTLTADQLRLVANAIQKIEGYTPGRVTQK
jgi:hypothetical protein